MTRITACRLARLYNFITIKDDVDSLPPLWDLFYPSPLLPTPLLSPLVYRPSPLSFASVINMYEHRRGNCFPPSHLCALVKGIYSTGFKSLWWLIVAVRLGFCWPGEAWMGAVMSEGRGAPLAVSSPGAVVSSLLPCLRSSDSTLVTLLNESR